MNMANFIACTWLSLPKIANLQKELKTFTDVLDPFRLHFIKEILSKYLVDDGVALNGFYSGSDFKTLYNNWCNLKSAKRAADDLAVQKFLCNYEDRDVLNQIGITNNVLNLWDSQHNKSARPPS